MFQKLKKNIPLVCIIFFFIFINIIFIHPISGNDTWFHLRIGQDIWETKTISLKDFHSFTNSGTSYINQSWLAQIFLYLVYKSTGLIGLQAFHSVSIFLMFFFLFLLGRKKNFHLSLISIIFTIPFIIGHNEIRPYLFTWLFIPLILFLIDRKLLYIIPFIFLLWANIHAGFIIGIVFLFYYLLQKSIKSKKVYPLIIFFLSLIATFINPYGPKIYLYPLTLGDAPQMFHIAEWTPFSPKSVQFWIYSFYFLVLIITSFKRKIYSTNIIELIFIVSLALFGYTAQRQPLIILLILFPIFTKNLSSIPFLNSKLLIYPISCLSLFIIYLALPQHYQPNLGLGIDSFNVPVYSTKFISDNNLNHIFNDYGFGGYLLWAYPSQPIFIDGRLEIYKGKTLSDYMRVVNGSSNWKQILNDYHIDCIFLQNAAPINNLLIMDPDWDLVYFDGASNIFLRHGTSPNVPRLKNITPVGARVPNQYELNIQEFQYLLDKNPQFCDAYMFIAQNYTSLSKMTLAKTNLQKFLSLCPQLKNLPDVVSFRKWLNISD